MLKYIYLLILFITVILLENNCSTAEKAIKNSHVELSTSKTLETSNEISKEVKEYNSTVNYIPDSISEITINLVGDLMCHLPQTNNAKLSNGEFDFNPSFEFIKPFLQDADITIGNLETTFAGTSQPYAGYPAFNSPDAYCNAIKEAGFDFLVTANNHSMDTREEGIIRTIDVIAKNGLGYCGTYLSKRDHDSIRIINIKGIKLGILNYTYGTNGSYPQADHKYMLNIIDSANITDAVKVAKQKGSDIVLVFYHMGLENIKEPTQAQHDAVRYALDAGAGIVIGAHPHVIGPTKTIYSKTINDTAFIAYSLGNFLSNQYWRYTDAGVILKLTVKKNVTKNITSFKNASYMPTWVYRGDGIKKMHVLFPAHWANDSTKLPAYINSSHKQKMLEALEDTKFIITKYNKKIGLNFVD